MVVSACLVANNSDLISPDVLAADKKKYEQTGDEKYISKAHRRGKVGWNLGSHIEMSPHIRVPHMALRWTGVGRKIPRMVMVKGAVIHRELVDKVPTGEQGPIATASANPSHPPSLFC